MDQTTSGLTSGLQVELASIAGTDRSGWSSAAKSDAVLELLAAQERMSALVLSFVGDWDADQSWALDSSLSPVAWLAHRAPLTRQRASTLVRTATTVPGQGLWENGTTISGNSPRGPPFFTSL